MVLAYQAYRTHLTLPNKSIIPYCIPTVTCGRRYQSWINRRCDECDGSLGRVPYYLGERF